MRAPAATIRARSLPHHYARPSNRPVLSPNESAFTPMRSSSDRYRLHSGVFVRSAQTASRTQRAFPVAREQQRKILFQMAIAVFDRAAEHDHGIIEQRSSAFVEALHLVQEVRHLLHVPVDDLFVLVARGRDIAVVR